MQMIKIPSFVDETNNETNLAMFINDYFTRHGINSRLDWINEKRCNVIATIGSSSGLKLLLTGHLDTVPLYNNDSLLKPVIIDNKVYGRGANDMKGSLAAMMMSMVDLKNNCVDLNGSVTFIGVIDEELGSLGTIDLIEKGYDFDAAIVGEPTSLEICTGHRGLEWVTFKSFGSRIHSGHRDCECNAIENIISLLSEIKKDLPIERHPLLGNTTFNIGKIVGGTQPSTVADYCEASVDFRYLPKQSFSEIKEFIDDKINKINKNIPDARIEYSIYEGSKMKDGFFHDPCFIDESEEIVISAQEVLSEYNYSIRLNSFSAWTDGGLINTHLKIPTIILGAGDLETAHSNEEHIYINELYDASQIYYEICIKYLK